MGRFIQWTSYVNICLIIFTSRATAFYDYQSNDYASDLSMDWSVLGIRAHQPKCVDIPDSMTLCRNIGYKTMRLPNLLDHESIAEAVDQARVWVPLLNLHCHPDTKLFLCSLYSPVCLEPSVYPCKSLCEGVKRGCEERINNYGFPWPEILKCDQFPEQMCIEQVNFENAANVCEPCKKPMTFESLLDGYCWSTYVLKVKIRKVVEDNNGDKRLILKRKVKSFKPKSMPKKEKKNLNLVIQNGTKCDCDVAEKAKKSSLVMATKVGDKYVVTYVSDWVKDKEFKRAIRAIRKGHDCKVPIDPEQTDSLNGGLSIDGSPLPTVDSPPDMGNGKKKNKNRDKGRKKGKKDKDKDKDNNKSDEDPMANIAGIGCIPCKQPLVFENLIEKYCDAHFVMMARVKKIEMDNNGDKRLVVRKLRSKDIYKQENLSARDIKKLQPVIGGGSSCDCQSAAKGNKLFLMGRKEGLRYVLNFLNEDANDSEFKRFSRAIKKGYDCPGVPNNN